MLPTKNFINGGFEGADNINGIKLNSTILKKREGCYACAIRCKRAVEVEREGLKVDIKYGGPEYETLAAFGSLCMVDDLEIIAKANELCNKYSLDTISTGATIAFVMECREKGLITEEELDGIDVSFGNGEAILQLVEKIGKREGIGDLLAEGSARIAKKLGREAEKILITIKGQELPMHDPRGKIGVGIGYAVSETGADHMLAPHDTLYTQDNDTFRELKKFGILEPLTAMDMSWKKIRAYSYLQMYWSFLNSAGVCDFGPAPRGSMPIGDFIELIQAVTGWSTDLWEMLKVGERNINLCRLFNIREGFTKDDDTLPERLFEPLGKGLKNVIDRDEFNRALDLYYDIMGWDEDGVPRKGKLMELNLGEFI